MKSIKLNFLEKLLIITLLVSITACISITNKPTTLDNKNAKLNLNDRKKSSSLNKNKNETDINNGTSSNNNSTEIIPQPNVLIINNTISNDEVNPPSPNKTEVNNNTNTDIIPINSNNTTPANSSQTNQTVEDDVYYHPQIGGIKILNPLPQNIGVIGCKTCSPQVMDMSKKKQVDEDLTLKEAPGVKFQRVGYVRELSPGGKKALEIEKLDEYFILIFF